MKRKSLSQVPGKLEYNSNRYNPKNHRKWNSKGKEEKEKRGDGI